MTSSLNPASTYARVTVGVYSTTLSSWSVPTALSVTEAAGHHDREDQTQRVHGQAPLTARHTFPGIFARRGSGHARLPR
jgi:hypothetical protein